MLMCESFILAVGSYSLATVAADSLMVPANQRETERLSANDTAQQASEDDMAKRA